MIARLATLEDAPQLAALFTLPHVCDFVHAPSEDDVRSVIGKSGLASWVIERDGEIVGHMLLGDGDGYGGWLWEVRTIVVKHQREGIGACAMRHAIAAAKAGNSGARALYERLGFAQEGCYRDGYRNEDGTYENLIPYGLLLSETD